MNKSTVVAHFGSHEKVADFIGFIRGKPFTRTAVTMWPELIPSPWALFFDQYTGLSFDKTLYKTFYQTQKDAV